MRRTLSVLLSIALLLPCGLPAQEGEPPPKQPDPPPAAQEIANAYKAKPGQGPLAGMVDKYVKAAVGATDLTNVPLNKLGAALDKLVEELKREGEDITREKLLERLAQEAEAEKASEGQPDKNADGTPAVPQGQEPSGTAGKATPGQKKTAQDLWDLSKELLSPEQQGAMIAKAKNMVNGLFGTPTGASGADPVRVNPRNIKQEPYQTRARSAVKEILEKGRSKPPVSTKINAVPKVSVGTTSPQPRRKAVEGIAAAGKAATEAVFTRQQPKNSPFDGMSQKQKNRHFLGHREQFAKRQDALADKALRGIGAKPGQYQGLQAKDEVLTKAIDGILKGVNIPEGATPKEAMRLQFEALRKSSPDLALYYAESLRYQSFVQQAVDANALTPDMKLSPWEVGLSGSGVSGITASQMVSSDGKTFSGLSFQTGDTTVFRSARGSETLVSETSAKTGRSLETRTTLDSQGRVVLERKTLREQGKTLQTAETVTDYAKKRSTLVVRDASGIELTRAEVDLATGRRTLTDHQEKKTTVIHPDRSAEVTYGDPKSPIASVKGKLGEDGRLSPEEIVWRDGRRAEVLSPDILKVHDPKSGTTALQASLGGPADVGAGKDAQRLRALAAQMVELAGIKDKDLTPSLQAWLTMAMRTLDPKTTQGVSLSMSPDGKDFSLVVDRADGKKVIHTAEWGTSSPYKGKTAPALLVKEPVIAGERIDKPLSIAAEYGRDFIQRWEARSPKTEAGIRSNETTDHKLTLLRSQMLSEGIWKMTGSEVKNSVRVETPRTSSLAAVGDLPGIRHTLKVFDMSGNVAKAAYGNIISGFQGAIEVAQTDIFASANEMVNVTNRERVANSAMGYARDLRGDRALVEQLTGDNLKLLTSLALAYRGQTLREQNLHPDRDRAVFAQNLDVKKHPVTDKELVDALLRGYGYSTVGTRCFELAQDSSGLGKFGWAALGFMGEVSTKTGEILMDPTFLAMGVTAPWAQTSRFWAGVHKTAFVGFTSQMAGSTLTGALDTYDKFKEGDFVGGMKSLSDTFVTSFFLGHTAYKYATRGQTAAQEQDAALAKEAELSARAVKETKPLSTPKIEMKGVDPYDFARRVSAELSTEGLASVPAAEPAPPAKPAAGPVAAGRAQAESPASPRSPPKTDPRSGPFQEDLTVVWRDPATGAKRVTVIPGEKTLDAMVKEKLSVWDRMFLTPEKLAVARESLKLNAILDSMLPSDIKLEVAKKAAPGDIFRLIKAHEDAGALTTGQRIGGKTLGALGALFGVPVESLQFDAKGNLTVKTTGHGGLGALLSPMQRFSWPWLALDLNAPAHEMAAHGGQYALLLGAAKDGAGIGPGKGSTPAEILPEVARIMNHGSGRFYPFNGKTEVTGARPFERTGDAWELIRDLKRTVESYLKTQYPPEEAARRSAQFNQYADAQADFLKPYLPRLFSAEAAGVEGQPGRAAGLDNAMHGRRKALELLGFDPERSETGSPMGLPDKPNQVKPVGENHVQKTFPGRQGRIEAANELLMRNIMALFPEFSGVFDTPQALAYTRGLLSRETVLVMEKAPGTTNPYDFRQLTAQQKAAIGVLARAFGWDDVNPGAALFRGEGKPGLVDFERAGSRVEPNPRLTPSAMMLEDMPWLDQSSRNRLADFLPTIKSVTERFNRPETQQALLQAMERSGFSSRQAQTLLDNFRGNVGRLEAVLQADIGVANRYFSDTARRAGLTPDQAERLSEINRSARDSPDGGALRDEVRALNQRIARALGREDPGRLLRGQKMLQPEELASLLENRDKVPPAGLSPALRSMLRPNKTVSLDDYALFNSEGSQGDVYQSGPTLLKVFRSGQVEPRHVQELAALSQRLAKEGVPVVPMEAVELSDGRWGLRMPLVKGEPLGKALDRLNPDSDILTDPQARALQEKAFDILRDIDKRTGNLADRRQSGFFDPADDFANFILTDRGLVNIDPINIISLRVRMDEGRRLKPLVQVP